MLTRLYSITASDFCKVDVNTVLYDWDYSQFCQLEKYVDFCEDRRKWSEKGEQEDQRIAKAREQAKQTRG